MGSNLVSEGRKVMAFEKAFDVKLCSYIQERVWPGGGGLQLIAELSVESALRFPKFGDRNASGLTIQYSVFHDHPGIADIFDINGRITFHSEQVCQQTFFDAADLTAKTKYLSID